MATPEGSTDPEHNYFNPDTANAAPAAPEDPGMDPGEPVDTGDLELQGIRNVKIASLLGFIGILITIVMPVVLLFAAGIGFNLANDADTINGSNVTSFFNFLEAAVILLTVGPLLLVVSFLSYVLGLAKLRRADTTFTAPLVLVVIGLIGFLMLAAGFGLILEVVLQVLTCGGAGNVTPGCVDGTPAGLGALLLLGGILPALIGWIGLVLGLYRVGKRYSSTLTKIGGILYIIPFANLIAPILVWLGAREIEKVLVVPVAAAPEPDPPYAA
jgi:hypothetical protein